MKKHTSPAFSACYALLAAGFYAINTPLSKLLLEVIPATLMAGFLYLGAGVGVGGLYLLSLKKERKEDRLTIQDSPYVIAMILLDILAPIFLMLGIRYGTASGASLLGNFEIVATTVIALAAFRETVGKRFWSAIALITLSSILLSFEGTKELQFSAGSLFVLLATVCWGLENNCTRRIANRSIYQIVVLKGFFSGGGALLLGLFLGEELPSVGFAICAMALGFVAYGLSIFLYIRAQRDLGAAKTSAYYAVAPFVGAFLSFFLLGEPLTGLYFGALLLMVAGTVLVVADTLAHTHQHTHTLIHTHDGSTHTHTIVHTHDHLHCGTPAHNHRHSTHMLEALAHSEVAHGKGGAS